VGSLRNSRRRGHDPPETASGTVHAIGAHHVGGATFVTGQLLRV
jgi:hypothetical protein